MLIAFFSVKEKEKMSCFFEKTFLLADISINVTLKLLFFILSNNENDFTGCYYY